MNETERKALDVVLGTRTMAWISFPSGRIDWEAQLGSAIEALSAAGLLVTPLHERALGACRDYARNREFPVGEQAAEDVRTVGREALALEKPKDAWRVQPAGDGGVGSRPMLVRDSRSIALVGMTDAEARAIAEALNALEAGLG